MISLLFKIRNSDFKVNKEAKYVWIRWYLHKSVMYGKKLLCGLELGSACLSNAILYGKVNLSFGAKAEDGLKVENWYPP